MADITATLKDGLGIGDNSKSNSKSKSVDDYIVTDDNKKVNDGLLSNSLSEYINVEPRVKLNDGLIEKETSDNIYESIETRHSFSEIPKTDDFISLADDNFNNTYTAVTNQRTDDCIALSDSTTQEVFVNINSPENTSEYLHRDNITFSGTALKNGIIIDADKIKWSSSIDGFFYKGNNFTYDRLSVGIHKIRMYIEDENIDAEIMLKIKRTIKSNRPENLTEV